MVTRGNCAASALRADSITESPTAVVESPKASCPAATTGGTCVATAVGEAVVPGLGEADPDGADDDGATVGNAESPTDVIPARSSSAEGS